MLIDFYLDLKNIATTLDEQFREQYFLANNFEKVSIY